MAAPTTPEVDSVRGCQPGTIALRDVARSAYGLGPDMGCYNRRSVRGGSTWSYHAAGRGVDLAGSPSAMAKAAEGLVARAGALGIDEVIYNRQIWSAARGSWRAYGGVNPHTDHIHVSHSQEGARSLTAARAAEIMGTDAPAGGGTMPGGPMTFGPSDIPIIGGAVSGIESLVELATFAKKLADPAFWRRVGLGVLGAAILVGGLVLIFKDISVDVVADVAADVLE